MMESLNGAEDTPPTPPTLSYHISAPSISPMENEAFPLLIRASTAPSRLHSVGLCFSDKSLELLIQPSTRERTPSKDPDSTTSEAIIDEHLKEALSDQPKQADDFSSTDEFAAVFGIASTIERELVFKDPNVGNALFQLSPEYYEVLHNSEALPLQVGDEIETSASVMTKVAQDNVTINVEDIRAYIVSTEASTSNMVSVAYMYEGEVIHSESFVDADETIENQSRSWDFKVLNLVPRKAHEVWLRGDVTRLKLSPASSERDSNQCCICFESHDELLRRICERPDQPVADGCQVACCRDCFQAHIVNTVISSQFSIAPVRCPGAMCGRRLPMERWCYEASWGEYQKPAPLRVYLANPRALTSIRCPWCDLVVVLFPDAALGVDARNAASEVVMDGVSVDSLDPLCRMWCGYSKGDLSAADFVEELLRLEKQQSLTLVEEAPPEQLDVVMKLGLLPLIVDVERRAALHLTWLRRFPKICLSECSCEAPICFKCKVEEHHDGQTCAEYQASEVYMDAQYCPTCGVATIKSEGCDHIICVCGAHWQWEE